jgi:autotransporter-associated beta strand protein
LAERAVRDGTGGSLEQRRGRQLVFRKQLAGRHRSSRCRWLFVGSSLRHRRGASTISTHDLNNGFQVNRLTFSQTSGTVLTLASSGGRNIVLSGGGTMITQEHAGTASITAPLLLNPSDNLVTATASSAGGILSLDAALSGASPLRVGGGGLGTVRLNAANSHAGSTTLTSGTLEFANDAAFGSGNVSIGAGTLRLLGPWTSSRGIQVSGSAGNPNNIDLSRKVDTNGFDATWNGTLTGVAALTKSGAGTLALTTTVPFSGNLTVDGGTMLLRGGAAIQSDRISVNSGAELELDETGSTGPRLKSSLALTLTGGGLRVIGDSTTATNVNIGSLAVSSSGLSSNIGLVAQGTGSLTLQAGTFIRSTAEMLVRADALGGASGTSFTRLAVWNCSFRRRRHRSRRVYRPDTRRWGKPYDLQWEQ